MKAEEVKRAAVIGVGTMGPGIALSLAQAGIEVRLMGRSQESCQRGTAAVEGILALYREHGLLTKGRAEAAYARIKGATGLEEADQEADLVIEAAPEELDLKKDLFARLDAVCPPRTILASNTSGLSITALGKATKRPDKVVGAHFWNPPHLLPLVEVVRGEGTSEETLELTAGLMEIIGKRPVLVRKEVPGFIGTRLHQALIREAFYLVEEGVASIRDVDEVVKTSFGRRLAVTGPFETCDLGGLDVFLAAAGSWADLSRAREPSPLLADQVQKGRLGAKTKAGLYDWTSQDLARIVREREAELISHLKKDLEKRG